MCYEDFCFFFLVFNVLVLYISVRHGFVWFTVTRTMYFYDIDLVFFLLYVGCTVKVVQEAFLTIYMVIRTNLSLHLREDWATVLVMGAT